MLRWLALLLLLTCPASAQLLTTGAGCQPAVCSGGGGYQGPGDVVSGATAWYGLRGYNAAYATGSNNAINIRRASDNSTSNIVILSNGNLDTATAASFAGTDATASCTVSGTSATCSGASATIHVNDPVTGTGITVPCVVTATNGSTTATISIAGTTTSCGTIGTATTLTFQVALFATEAYDQSGNTIHITQATSGSQPQVLLSCASALPCFYFNGAQKLVSGTISTHAQPITFSYVGNRKANFSAINIAMSTFLAGSNCDLGWDSTANAVYGFCGTRTNITGVSDGVLHSVSGVMNGASSPFNVDGTVTTINVNTAATGTQIAIGDNPASYSQALVGYLSETGLWPTGFTSGNQTSMCHQQFTYWGTATSC